MGESKISEKLNSECNNIFVDKSQPSSERNMMNESFESTGSITDDTTMVKNHIHSEAEVKEEDFQLFNDEDTTTPALLQKNSVQGDLEHFGTDDICSEPADEKTENDSDEETIATFITAAGQQLALYAVEDSDEIFAVAVYDESGEPPTNFQFLMKSDVEKLIGEGAVRTVKKPSQLKKQVFVEEGAINTITADVNTQPEPHQSPIRKLPEPCRSPVRKAPQPYHGPVRKVPEVHHSPVRKVPEPHLSPIRKVPESHRSPIRKVTEVHRSPIRKVPQQKVVRSPNVNLIKRVKQEPSTLTSQTPRSHYGKVTKGTNFAQASSTRSALTQGNWSENVFLIVHDGTIATKKEEVAQEVESELMEKSTVQYILSEDPPDSSDLTFDDIEEVLKRTNHSTVAKRPKPVVREVKDHVTIKVEKDLETNGDNDSDHDAFGDDLNDTTVSEESEKNPSDKNSDENNKYTKASSPDILKIKRPRKQQLTIVNRTDSEIIIQPASLVEMLDDENENGYGYRRKKRGKRRKKKEPTVRTAPYMRTRRRGSHPVKSPRRKTFRIEVIDIDVEDVNREIITVEDGKEKGSSDKENDVIMVGDSDEEEEKDKEVEVEDNSDDSDYDDEREKKLSRKVPSKRMIRNMFKCQHCNRRFRLKRALETHSRICPKSPSPLDRISERTRRTAPMRSTRLSKSSSDSTVRDKKQYDCKTCHESFDVVVALARHVRLMHSLKKKVNNSTPDKQTSAPVEVVKKKEEKKLTRRGRPPPESPPSVKGASKRFIKQNKLQEKKSIERSKRKERFTAKIRKIHSWKNKSTKKMNCTDCGRWFPSVALLLAHSLQHATKKSVSEKTKYRRCQLCKKLFKSRSLYVRHMSMHKNKVPLRKKDRTTTKQSVTPITPLKKRGRPRKL